MSVLTGSLEVFPLPDVFRLLSRNDITGALRVERESGDGVVYFRDGEVYFAFSSLTREFLGQRLVGAKLITQGQLLRLLDEQKRSGNRRLGDLLVEKGYLSQELLDTFIKEQIQDAIFHLLHWDTGTFEVDLGEVSSQEVGLAVSVENLIMESSRRLEEWEVIQRKIPNLDVILRMSPTPPEDAVEINIKPDEWTLLVLADGVRSVRDIAAATERSEFETAKILYGLVASGLLDVGATPESGEPLVPPVRARRVKAKEPEPAARVETPQTPEEPSRKRPTKKTVTEEEVSPAAAVAPRNAVETAESPVEITTSVFDSASSEDWASAFPESFEQPQEPQPIAQGAEWTPVTGEPAMEAVVASEPADSAVAVATTPEAVATPPVEVAPVAEAKAKRTSKTRESVISKEVLMRLIAGVRNL